MKKDNLCVHFRSKKLFRILLPLIFCILSFNSNIGVVLAATQSDLRDSDSVVIEYLRISVPSKDRKAWIFAEKNSWEPWLKEQKGFLGRQLLWDQKNEEALLLISWASRKDWKSIPESEIDNVQEIFEKISIQEIGQNHHNPFPIQAQGELFPQ